MNQNLLRLFLPLIIVASSFSVTAQQQAIKITDFTVSRHHEKVAIDWKIDGAVEWRLIYIGRIQHLKPAVRNGGTHETNDARCKLAN